MRILVVCSGNTRSGSFSFEIHQSFIYEQSEALRKTCGIDYDVFLIEGRGLWGYLSNLRALRHKIMTGKYDLVHAHYGLSGLLAVAQRHTPVIITYHGTDIDLTFERILSRIAMRCSAFNIFVTRRLAEKVSAGQNAAIISCGVDFDKTFPMDRSEARRLCSFESEKRYVLFSSSFDNPVKNYGLARRAVALVEGIELVELKGYNRTKVNALMNACDALLVTSFHESGPLVVKEALVSGCPVVSTDVGDVKEVVAGLDGCFISSYEPEDVARKLEQAIKWMRGTGVQRKIAHLDNRVIARQIYEVYQAVLRKQSGRTSDLEDLKKDDRNN